MIRFAMQQLFKAEPKRHFVFNKLFDFAAVFGLLTLFIVLVAGKIFYALKAADISARVGLPFSYVGDLVVPIVVVAALIILYFIFCPARARLSELLAGSVTAAVLLAVMRPLFAWFLKYNPEYGYAFGSLKTIFLVLIWIYYSVAVILFGAVVIAVMRRREALLLKGLFHGAHVKASGLSRLLLNKLTRTYHKGQYIFSEEQPGAEMYFIVEGGVDLMKGGKLLKRVEHGEYFGEMAMLLNVPRTTTAVVCEDDTRLISINAGNFSVIMHENPDIVLALLKEMAERLRETDYALIAASKPAGGGKDR
jgi:membrane protein